MLLRFDPPATGAANMALDEALLRAADRTGLAALRLYGWDPPTLSFGRNEPASRRYDRQAILARGIATVRRPTGGRAVWHHREVTYAVAAPVDTFGTLRDTYREIHDLLAEALRTLGAPVALAPDRGALAVGAGACFAAPAGGEVVAKDGAKVVGSAQVRVGGAFLQHGSILLESDQNLVTSVTRGAAAAPHAAGLAGMLPPNQAGWRQVADAVAAAARRRWQARDQATDWPDDILSEAREREDRFLDDAWTWRR